MLVQAALVHCVGVHDDSCGCHLAQTTHQVAGKSQSSQAFSFPILKERPGDKFSDFDKIWKKKRSQFLEVNYKIDIKSDLFE